MGGRNLQEGQCVDTEEKFRVKGIRGKKDCVWAGRGRNCNRSLTGASGGGKVRDVCPVTCGECVATDAPTDAPTDGPTQSPTDEPTLSPTSSPTASPTES